MRNNIKYIHLDKENNKIGGEGCKHLGNSQWPLLKSIDISKVIQK
jgi:hypothetical protein